MRERTLIWQQLHLRFPEQGRLWATNQRLLRRLNPDCDFLVIDNASPLDPAQFCGDMFGLHLQLEPMDDWVPELPANVGAGAMIRFHESLGHFFHGHTDGLPCRDGPGRAHDRALRVASCSGYQRACYIEADALFRHPVQWVFDQMTKPVGCQPLCAYGYLDWHVWAIKDLPWLMQFDFLGKYDWKNRKGEAGGEKTGEHVYADIFGPDNLDVVAMSGLRGDTIALTADTYPQHFPQGCDYLTHVGLRCFALWLDSVSHGDLAEGLRPF